MRNDTPSSIYTSKQIFSEVGPTLRNGKKSKNATNYISIKSMVETAIDQYDMQVSSLHFTLEKLQSIPINSEQKKTASHIYDTAQKEHIQKLRNDLLKINGKGGVYLCPLCQVDYVEHLDHYIPRSLMPEFSVHPKNLIYLCHSCNENKKEKWLDKNGDRICFNSYFDKPSGLKILLCEIILVDKLPFARVYENNNIVHTTQSKMELSTYKELGIIDRYQLKVNKALQQECIRLTSLIKVCGKKGLNPSECCSLIKESYEECLHKSDVDVINSLLYEGIITSEVMNSWIDSEITKEDESEAVLNNN